MMMILKKQESCKIGLTPSLPTGNERHRAKLKPSNKLLRYNKAKDLKVYQPIYSRPAKSMIQKPTMKAELERRKSKAN